MTNSPPASGDTHQRSPTDIPSRGRRTTNRCSDDCRSEGPSLPCPTDVDAAPFVAFIASRGPGRSIANASSVTSRRRPRLPAITARPRDQSRARAVAP